MLNFSILKMCNVQNYVFSSADLDQRKKSTAFAKLLSFYLIADIKKCIKSQKRGNE
jgi:hypothetical protein